MVERNDYDQGLRDVRMKMAKERTEWFKFFLIRDKYIKLMILSFFSVWAILGSSAILFDLNGYFLFVVPNILWIFFIAPFFGFKINQLSKIINSKKEDLVIHVWKTKTQQIDEIMLLTGLDKIFVEFYLTKNGLEPDQVEKSFTSSQNE